MITESELKNILHYNESTGVFTWIAKTSPRSKVGFEAGNEFSPGHQKNKNKYRRIKINGTHYYSHRLAWLYVYGEFPKNNIDHIDGNGLNNSISNLRDASQSENMRNQSLSDNNTSGFTGVSYARDRDKWHSQIQVNGKKISLGFFDDKDLAIQVRQEANKKYNYHVNHGRQR